MTPPRTSTWCDYSLKLQSKEKLNFGFEDTVYDFEMPWIPFPKTTFGPKALVVTFIISQCFELEMTFEWGPAGGRDGEMLFKTTPAISITSLKKMAVLTFSRKPFRTNEILARLLPCGNVDSWSKRKKLLLLLLISTLLWMRYAPFGG